MADAYSFVKGGKLKLKGQKDKKYVLIIKYFLRRYFSPYSAEIIELSSVVRPTQ